MFLKQTVRPVTILLDESIEDFLMGLDGRLVDREVRRSSSAQIKMHVVDGPLE